MEGVDLITPSAIQPNSSTTATSSTRRPRQRNRNRGPNSVASSSAPQDPIEGPQNPRPPQTARPVRHRRSRDAGSSVDTESTSTEHNKPRRNRRNPDRGGRALPASSDVQVPAAGSSRSSNNALQTQQPRAQRSRKQFGSRLTSNEASASTNSPVSARAPRPATVNPADMDLTSRLIHAFTHKEDALDCPICFNSIHPAQPIWSCSPSEGVDTSCWTTFHLKCVRSWAQKSVKETRDAYRARNEEREGEWRCPGCQTKRHDVPVVYKCFCGRVQDPKGGRLITPHSCGEPCVRQRTCEHPCSLPCHPGPCPPCLLSVEKICYCGQEKLVMRCSRMREEEQNMSLSCGRKCSRPLSCGKHVCQLECHPGECDPCGEQDTVRCYCGKEQKTVPCGEGVAKSCLVIEDSGPIEWEGRFECESPCDRPFDCGAHRCKQKCHPPSPTPALCPLDPSIILTCPCGKNPLEALPNGYRTKCTDPIPTCQSTCGKQHSTCSHACLSPCHTGPCPPCNVQISVACRCGETVRYVSCSVRRAALEAGEGEILCNTKCNGMRHCGRHACTRVCCPLTGQQKKGGKGRKRTVDPIALETEDVEGWHTCDLTCNKRLSCGNHLCSQPDHRGPCPPCLQSSFEELTCNCGRTILMPPIPCGTKIECPYPCARPPPSCGHTKTPHPCHEEGECPPCPHLTSKVCACQKTTVTNVRCSQEKVSCGKPCGKLMDCGFHHCDKVCHTGDCGTCTQVCQKPRKLCHPLQHGCTSQCHAPSACPENEPCKAIVTLRCECGRLQQPATCGSCTANPASRGSGPFQLKCTQDCQIAKRNRNLAEALGIDTAKSKSKFPVVWTEDLISFFRTNSAFGVLVEKTLNDFVSSDKKVQVLPHMPLPRREFVHKMAEVYRITALDVDQEPHRSVQLSKRLDSRLPEPLLSKFIAASPLTSAAGVRRGLTDLKKTSTWGASPSFTIAAPTATLASRAAASATAAPSPLRTSPLLRPSSTAVPSSGPRYPHSALNAAIRPRLEVVEGTVPSRWDEE